MYLWDSTNGDKSCRWSVKETCKIIVLEGNAQIPRLQIEGASLDPNGIRLQGINESYTSAGSKDYTFKVIWNYNQEVLGEIRVDVDMRWFD